MNVYSLIESRIATALIALQKDGKLPADLDVSRVEAEAPRDATHGDFACNAAMVLAKAAKMKPRDIAEALKAKLEGEKDIAKVDVAGPGFLEHHHAASVLAQARADDPGQPRQVRPHGRRARA